MSYFQFTTWEICREALRLAVFTLGGLAMVVALAVLIGA